MARSFRKPQYNKLLPPAGFVNIVIPGPRRTVVLLDDRPRGLPENREKESRGLDDHPRGLPENRKKAFRELDEQLSAAKGAMDPITADPDNAEDLRLILFHMDLYRGLKRQIRTSYNGQIVTNAWLKLYEILSQLKIVETIQPGQQFGVMPVFSNAELPGGFISAINHYVVTIPMLSHDWVASSLYAEEENTALGDQYGLYENNKTKWLMNPQEKEIVEEDHRGRDETCGHCPHIMSYRNNGDVTRADNIVNLAARSRCILHNRDGVLLYTADAGLDINQDYANQEILNLKVHYGQALAGILALAEGGALIVKHYTFNHPFTISLIVYLSQIFKKLTITKPVTSRPSNSEVYLIGYQFLGISREDREILLNRLENFNLDVPLINLQNHEDEIIWRAAVFITRRQITFLKKAIDLYGRYGSDTHKLQRDISYEAKEAQKRWLYDNKVMVLDHDKSLSVAL